MSLVQSRRKRRLGSFLVAGLAGFGMLPAAPAYAASPSLSVKDVRVTEVDSGSNTAIVRVALSRPAVRRVTAHYTTVNGTARYGSDYVRQSGTVVIPRGRQVARIQVTLKGDRLDERNEALRLRISDPTNARVADAVGLVRIVDNDLPPRITAGDVAVDETDSGARVARFPVTLSEASGRTVRVAYSVSGVTAQSDVDYSITESTGILEFPAGTTSRSVGFVVLGDLAEESDEMVRLTLLEPVNSTLSDDTGFATIRDNDELSLSVDDATAIEGQNATFTVRLSRATNQAVTFNAATSNGTASSSSDYSATSVSGTIPAGATSTTVTVPTTNDLFTENTETFSMTLSNVANAAVKDGTATGTITDNDGPAISVGDATILEGQNGTVEVRLGAPQTRDVTFSWATASNTAGTSDYRSTSGTGTIKAGQLSTTIPLSTTQDTTDEVDETFHVNVSDPRNAVVADAQGVVTIDDNDGPAVTIANASKAEGSTANNAMPFTITLASASPQQVTVGWRTAPDGQNEATAGSDYTAVSSGSVTFAPGQTQQNINVLVQGDVTVEPDETFLVLLSNPVDAVLGNPSTATGTITNDDVESTDEGRANATSLGAVDGDRNGTALTRTGVIDLGDADWYKFTLTEGDLNSVEELNARIQLLVGDSPAQTSGDLDMAVYEGDSTGPLTYTNLTGTADESLNVKVTDGSGADDTVFYVKVFGKTAQITNSYSLSITGDIA